ncbi:MAG TPA: SMP-30/gluconolactonase/LRE family protein, partial [Bacteroidota bacterium]
PVWNDGFGLLFSDIWPGKIYRWTPDSGVSLYLFPSDSSNGLTYDRQGRLILTQMAKRRLCRRESDGTIVPLVSSFRGKKLNSPNDLVVKSDGSIFFTDPDFNVPGGPANKELTIKGIYRLNTSGALQLLDSTFDKPNGICFSPDEKELYVNESPQGKIYVWDVVNDSTVANKRLFYSIPIPGHADGMKTDPGGNVYCTGPTGVWIISPQGVLLDKIATPVNPTNCTWGDADRKTIYITARSTVFRMRLGSPEGAKQ